MEFVCSFSKYIYSLLIVGLSLLVAGCVTLTPEESAYQQKFMAQPTEFDLPKTQADEAWWGRAISFVNKYADMKIKETSDTMITTFMPPMGRYGYSIIRTPIGDKVKFIVNCLGELDPIPSHNAHIAALYIANGTEPLTGTLGDCHHVACN